MATDRPIKSLSELMDGGVEERFNEALDKLWQNVFDPNTNPTATRSLTLTVKIKPNERRDSCDFRVDVVPKLAPMNSLTQTVMLELRGDGRIIATERTDQIPGQLDFDGNEQPLPNVVEFGTSGSKAQ